MPGFGGFLKKALNPVHMAKRAVKDVNSTVRSTVGSAKAAIQGKNPIEIGKAAFRGWQDKGKAKAKLNTPGNISTGPALQKTAGPESLASSVGSAVGQSGGGFTGGTAWNALKSKPLFGK